VSMNDAISVVAVIKECSLKADGDRLSFEDIKLDGSDPNRINRLVKAGSKVTITIRPLQESLPGTEGGEAGSLSKDGKQPAKAGAKKVPAAAKTEAGSGKNGKGAKQTAEKKPAAAV